MVPGYVSVPRNQVSPMPTKGAGAGEDADVESGGSIAPG
jgi:hypothetical protein